MAIKGENVNSIIGEGSVFEGNFYIHGSLKIDGKFEGEIKTEEQIIIGETGKVKTNIAARRVIVAGTIIGNITATEEVHILETGRVLGDITTPVLKLESGVVLNGKVTISGGQKKDPKKIVEESYAAGPVMPPMSHVSSKKKGGEK